MTTPEPGRRLARD